MKSTAGLFIRISSEESYAKEVENIRFSCIAECKGRVLRSAVP